MDVRTIEGFAPRLEHEGSTKVWWLVDAREMFEQTAGGHLDSITELELPAGSSVTIPGRQAWTFWYVTAGRGRMLTRGEDREIAPGDMVLGEPGQKQELRPASANAGVHVLTFSVSTRGGSGVGTHEYRPSAPVDIRSIHGVRPEPFGQGGATIWWLARPGEFQSATEGGHLELVDEFEVAAGGEVHPHSHQTWEFYYGLFGRALMTIAGEERVMGPGDLVVIPSDAIHSIKPVGPNTGTRCFCFAVGIRGARAYDYDHDVPSEHKK
jgi:quercetin dioxygenase-like cupin family protein